MSEVYSQPIDNFLPYNFGDNYINLLVRDPHTLFAYWEISDNINEVFKREFGEEVLEKTVRVLKVTHAPSNTHQYIRISESANSWYIPVEDANSLYVVEIGRMISDQFFVSMETSNYSSTPGETASENMAAVFVDYYDLKNGKINLKEYINIESYRIISKGQNILGLSSLELYSDELRDNMLGISSESFTNR